MGAHGSAAAGGRNFRVVSGEIGEQFPHQPTPGMSQQVESRSFRQSPSEVEGVFGRVRTKRCVLEGDDSPFVSAAQAAPVFGIAKAGEGAFGVGEGPMDEDEERVAFVIENTGNLDALGSLEDQSIVYVVNAPHLGTSSPSRRFGVVGDGAVNELDQFAHRCLSHLVEHELDAQVGDPPEWVVALEETLQIVDR